MISNDFHLHLKCYVHLSYYLMFKYHPHQPPRPPPKKKLGDASDATSMYLIISCLDTPQKLRTYILVMFSIFTLTLKVIIFCSRLEKVINWSCFVLSITLRLNGHNLVNTANTNQIKISREREFFFYLNGQKSLPSFKSATLFTSRK